MSDNIQIAAALDDRYVIERELGSGGMAVVYLARDKKLDREVALKVLRPELGAVLGSDRFLTEIKISARLDHPHILTLIDSGEADGFLYYVLPYVRGESLRDRLNREHQLSIEDALAITKQVASALDYAHRQGLVHRDIKPENILLQEGEAMLADFGIALAVKEAGGNRLTQTGLSLGTPQYMSPEQATGDRGIDARSDVYSLAAVFYEMLAGEPPVTGASAQSMIAKLMTEQPTHLRVLRDTVSPEMDAAVAKALAKTAADRFPTAGDFVRALEAKSTTQASDNVAVPANRRRFQVAAVVAIVAAIAAATAVSVRRNKPVPHASLGDKTQLTSTGNVLVPAIAPDGKQLAYVTRTCGAKGCTYQAIVQDVGGTATRAILDGATAVYSLEWSPDRRNLMFTGTIGGRSGAFLLSALGGEPKFLRSGPATFYAGGDSLLLGPMYKPDSVFYIRVTALDGIARDSIRVASAGQGMGSLSVIPGTNFILALIIQSPHGLWQVIDRGGKVLDKVVNACTCGGLAATDAVWLARAGDGVEESVIRIAVDRTNGHLATRQDTMAHGLFTQFSLTSDGQGMVMDVGIFDHSVWAVSLADALKGVLPDDKRIAHASSPVAATISPDGSRLLVRRNLPTAGGVNENRYSIMPFGGGTETPLPVSGKPIRVTWSDSVTVNVSTQASGKVHLAEVDVRTGVQRNGLEVPDSVVVDFAPLPNGWVWIPAQADRLVVSTAGQRHDYPNPKGIGGTARIITDVARSRVLFNGYGGTSGDSAVFGTFSPTDGKFTILTMKFAEATYITPLTGAHAALFAVAEAQDTWHLYAVDGPGQLTSLGQIPRAVQTFSVSEDLSRAAVTVRDYRADAWLHKVVSH